MANFEKLGNKKLQSDLTVMKLKRPIHSEKEVSAIDVQAIRHFYRRGGPCLKEN